MGQHALQAADRQGERGDVVVIEDARGHQGPQRLAAAIGQEGDLAGEVSRQLVEGPAESIEPAQDPFQPLLVLAADLLGDDPVLAGRPDIVEIGLHQRLRGDARRGRRERQPQVFHVETSPQPERAHEHRLAHAMNLAQGGPVGIGGNDLLAVDLGMEDLVNDAVDGPDAQHDGPSQAASQRERQEGDPAAGQMGFVEGERVDRPGRQRQLVERKAAKGAADVLLAVAPHQLGDLRAEPGVNLGVALGFVGQEVDRRELDRLQECAGLAAG